MSAQPTFTVLVTASHEPSQLRPALESLLTQTNPDWEAIVLGANFTPSTTALVEEYAKRDPRIQLLQLRVQGTPTTLETVLHQARGTWFCWLTPGSLFDERKLEIHQQAIEREPQTLLFHSARRVATSEGGTYAMLTHPLEYGQSSANRAWQIVQLLQADFFSGTTLCVARAALEKISRGNQHLFAEQTYQLWLHLLVQHSATYLAEVTAIQPVPYGQTPQSLLEAQAFDASRVTIEFLNQHRLEQLFPGVDFAEPQQAKAAVEQALDAAATLSAPRLYALGPHPALLWRIVEWLLHNPTSHAAKVSLASAKAKIRALLQRENLDPTFRLQWKAAYAALHLRKGIFHFTAIAPDEVAKQAYWRLTPQQGEARSRLYAYLLARGHQPDASPSSPASSLHFNEVVIVGQKGAQVDGEIKYGAARAWMELAHHLIRMGKPVLLLGIAQNRLGITENVPFLGVQNEQELLKALALLSPIDTLVGISRADIFPGITVARPLIYQHGPHLPMGEFVVPLIRRFKLPVVVVSRDSLNYQQRHGVPAEQLHVVYNGYSADIFQTNQDIAHVPHRLIFAARSLHGKGQDLAVRAFQYLRDKFPDAEFHIFGDNRPWPSDPPHLWAAHWLDPNGYPAWQTIEQELPGIKYCGEATPEQLADAFQRASLLVMPSRIHETFGLVSIEAQACGAIPVLPNRGGFPETLQDGRTGYLYDDNTAEALAETITSLWEAQLPTEDQRQKAAQWVQAEFSWQKTGEEFIRVLVSLPPRATPLPFIESLLWQKRVHWTAQARAFYSEMQSPLLRNTIHKSLKLLRRFSRKK